MIAMIKVEMEKLFCSKWFYLSILGMVLGMMLNGQELMRYSLHDTVSGLFVLTRTEGFALLSFILCVTGGGISFCIEQKGQNVRYIVLRGTAENYAVGKIISAFAGGYLITFLGFFLGELSMTIPLYLQQGSWTVVTSCIPEIGFDILHLLILSLRGGLLSVLALLVSLFLSDLFVTMIVPIVIYYAWLNITVWFSFPAFLDITIIYAAGSDYDTESFMWSQFWGDMGYGFLFTMCVVYGMGCIIVKQMKRRVEHG